MISVHPIVKCITHQHIIHWYFGVCVWVCVIRSGNFLLTQIQWLLA